MYPTCDALINLGAKHGVVSHNLIKHKLAHMVGQGKIIKALTYGWYGGVLNLEMFLAF